MGNLSYETTEYELREHLSQSGTIVDIYLATDRVTGRPRGFAFVTYSTEDEATDAISRFNGQEFGGRRLNVNEAEERPRREFNPGPSYGGGGGGGGFGGRQRKPPKAKGSRRGLRGRKRSL